jgi:hypothetical protein
MKTVIGEHDKIGVLIGRGELDAAGRRVPTFIVAPTQEDELRRRYDVLWGHGARPLAESEVIGYFTQQIDQLKQQAEYFGLTAEQITALLAKAFGEAQSA